MTSLDHLPFLHSQVAGSPEAEAGADALTGSGRTVRVQTRVTKPNRSPLAGVPGSLASITAFEQGSPTLVALTAPTAPAAPKQVDHRSELKPLELVVAVTYTDSLEKVLGVIQDVLVRETAVANEPRPEVTLHQLVTNSVELRVSASVSPADYWDVVARLTKGIKLAFFREGISVTSSGGTGRAVVRLRTPPASASP